MGETDESNFSKLYQQPYVKSRDYIPGMCEACYARIKKCRSALVAEDDQLNRKTALSMLKHLGYEVGVASNGIEVLQALERQQYDLVLMNLGMPVMDGITATKKIRRLWPTSVQPVIIAITASVLPSSREMCIAAGMDDYIPKPMRVDDLAIVLRRHCLEPKKPLT